MKQYQNDYSTVVKTKDGKTVDILVETFRSGTRNGIYEQYIQHMKEGQL